MASITSIHEAKNGTIWLGMDGSGLITYNGFNFNEIEVKGEDNDHHVSSIIELENEILFTSRYKGIFSYKDGKYKRLLTSTTEHGELEQLIVLSNGKKLVISEKGIFNFEKSKLYLIKKFNAEKQAFKINNIVYLENSTLILCSGGNFHLSNETLSISPLSSWLNVNNNFIKSVSFCHRKKDILYFYDEQLSRMVKVVLNYKEEIFNVSSLTPSFSLTGDERLVSTFSIPSMRAGGLSSKNQVYIFDGEEISKIAHNYSTKLEKCNHIILDRNNDFWVTSTLKGLYKISMEPFTKIHIHPIYHSSLINTIFRSKQGDVVIGTMDNTTSIGSLRIKDRKLETFPFSTFSVTEYNQKLYLATEKGIKIYDPQRVEVLEGSFPEINDDKITFLYLWEKTLYVGVANKGLKLFDIVTGKEQKTNFDNVLFPYIYTAQIDFGRKKIYFGSNNGLVALNLRNKNFERVELPPSMGTYLGVSTKDVYGTIWFTGEKALFGIRKNGDETIIDNPKYFSSTLFYTLNHDSFGNLIVGTNKGINILQINEFGDVLNADSYQGKTGFDGYETNMRAQFQDDKSIFVGTVEGLYLINTSLLQNLPKPFPPVISFEKGKNDNTIVFHFLIHNPKIKKIEYSYRIPGYLDKWSNYSSSNEVLLTDIPNGDYTFEVKATYDGVQTSEISKQTFTISVPFWKSKWFVFIMLICLVLINLYLINRNRTFSTGNIFNTQISGITIKLTPNILLFGFISDTAIHFIGPISSSEIHNNLGLTLFSGFILLGLYFISLSTKNNDKPFTYKLLLIGGFGVVMLHNLLDVYTSNLEPFFIFAVILINSLSPFIFEKVKSIITYSMIFILLNSLIMLQLENTVYNKTLFLIVVVFSAFLSVISTYLRHDALEKLLFISGVINNGNVPAIAFNSKGIMTYVSENILSTLGITSEKLMGLHISYLNSFIPEEGTYKRVDLTKEFEDNKKYLVPMIDPQEEIKWMEWSCKVFSENVKVILGQDVTERMKLEGNYELLVQNAEDLIYQVDVNGFFTFINDRCYEKLGYEPKELIGKHCLDMVPEGHLKTVSNFYRKHFENKLEKSYFEIPIETKDGTVIWIGQNTTTLFKPGNKKIVLGFLCLGRDITLEREQQSIIKQQKDDITASINYAQKIQLNILPSKSNLLNSFKECCILYRPKDIVSGDFYWHERIDDISIIALADCTGHGVPGSFVTLLGINILNNLVLEKHIFNPGIILNELDKRLINVLPRESGEDTFNDGMEISVLVFDHKNHELVFACAGSRFLIFDNNSFILYKGDSKHVGDRRPENFKGFVTHHVNISKNASIFLFTDGFQDQFGGNRNKKYSFRRMLEFFEANQRLPLNEQEFMLEEEFDKWKANSDQTDDVTILALRHLISE